MKKKEYFTQMEDFIEEQVWIDAQKLQQHIYTCGDSAYVLPNHKLFDKKLKVITKELIKKHIDAFESKTFSNFDKKESFGFMIIITELVNAKHFGKLAGGNIIWLFKFI